MNKPQRQNTGPLTATFIPGGQDDFYMPEVISPSPQRVTAELPARMEEALDMLELEAQPVKQRPGQNSLELDAGPFSQPSAATHALTTRKESVVSLSSPLVPHMPSFAITPSSTQPSQMSILNKNTEIESPSFSPFPTLKQRPPTVPPSDQEKENILENARLPVLNASDPEMQLSWAQDTLNFVDITVQYEARIAKGDANRPQTPAIEHQMKLDAINIVNFLADQGHPRADFQRGMWLEFGRFGFRTDKKEAFRCYQRSAQKNYMRAEYRMGTQFEYSNELDKAIKHYRLGSAANDSASNYRLGMMSLLGQHGIPQDYATGLQLIRSAAEKADENAPQGAYIYGMLLAKDLPQIPVPDQILPLNLPAAKYNIEKAAYLGFAKAQTKMGLAYELGQLGCEFNPLLSMHYNSLASKQGDAEAEMSISKWFLCGHESLFNKNEQLAFTYAERAASSGLATAAFALGYFYEVGISVGIDLRLSREWYVKAADKGNKDAAARIEGIARSKTLLRKDHESNAVARIKSQHGSHRGRRPERLTDVSSMPTISDETVQMPEPRVPMIQGGHAPYPSNFGLYGPQRRPKSTAPYPEDGRSPSMQTSAASVQSQPHHSSHRPPSPTPTETDTSYFDKNYRGSAFPTFRPKPAPIPGEAPNGNGVANAVSHSRPNPSTRMDRPHPPSNFRPNSGAPDQLRTYNLPQSQALRPSPVTDVGYSAPAETRPNNDPASKYKTSTSPAQAYSQGTTNQRPGRMGANLASPISPHAGRSPSPGRKPVGSTTVQAAPSSSNLPNPAKFSPNPKMNMGVHSSGGPSTAPPPASVTSTSGGKGHGKGPKTFHEMGVPSSKNESDCIIM